MGSSTQNAQRRGDAFALLYRTINENHAKDDFEFEIGSYRGFRLCLNLHPLSRGIILRGTSRYSTDIGSSGQGTITRIENLAERIPFYLVNTQRDLEEAESSWRLPVSRWASLLFMRKNCPKKLLP